jgi:hypothetical protein
MNYGQMSKAPTAKGPFYSCNTNITVPVLGGVPNVAPKKQEKIEICSCIYANLSCFCTFFAQLSTCSCGTNTQLSQIALNRTLNDYLGTMYEKNKYMIMFLGYILWVCPKC